MHKKTVFDVVIIGSGFSGLCAAIKLQESGINDYLILEKADEIGGTWRENHYPGAACDIQSHLYSFSFAGNPGWSQVYSGWQEIQEYLLGIVERFDLRNKIQFNQTLTSADFDESNGLWIVKTRATKNTKEKIFHARNIILGTGPLHVPAIPKISGLETFKGEIWHSSQWNHHFDLLKKRVASIGTGGSAIQYTPEIADKVERLDIYQRTPAWVLPRNERTYSKFEKLLFKKVPAIRKLYRSWIYWMNELRVIPMKFPKLAGLLEGLAQLHLKHQIKDAELRTKLKPDYRIGCKRVLISNQYYPMFNRENVHLITTGIKQVTPNGIIDQGGIERPVDAIILGTGFVVDPREFLKDVPIIGRQGVRLMDAWKEGAEAYLGICVAGFPNFFQMVGPNTGLGHNSIIFMIESQVAFIVDAIKKQKEKQALYMDLKADVQTAFNDKIQSDLKSTVWQSGCSSWYQSDDGKNFTIWPGTTFGYRRKTRLADSALFNWVYSEPEAKFEDNRKSA